jgi:hypothetical protein
MSTVEELVRRTYAPLGCAQEEVPSGGALYPAEALYQPKICCTATAYITCFFYS